MDSIYERWGRIILALALFAIATGVYYAWITRSGDGAYSIFDLARGLPVRDPPRPDSYTTAQGPLINLDEVALLARLNQEYISLIRAVVPSVVSIDIAKAVDPEAKYDNLLEPDNYSSAESRPADGRGSGVIVSEEGHILTNHHVIVGAAKIVVTLHSGQKYNAQLVGYDTRGDIAVLKIAGGVTERFASLPLGDSDEVEVGEMVFAVGNPLGFSESVTRGIISGKERRFTDADTGFFQTDTVINPGFSGGPLVNLRGEIIGINVYIYSGRRGLYIWQGIGLAVPSNEVAAVFKEIMNMGRPSRGYLGIGVVDIVPTNALQLGLNHSRGAIVSEVIRDSPAEHAGLLPNDVILTFNGKEVEDSHALYTEVHRQRVGSTVSLGVRRKREKAELSATIGEQSTEINIAPPTVGFARRSISDRLGIEVSDLRPEQKSRLSLLPESPAVLITRVAADSPAATSLQEGDLIHEINGRPIHTREEYLKTINAIPMDAITTIFVTRNGAITFVALDPRPAAGER